MRVRILTPLSIAVCLIVHSELPRAQQPPPAPKSGQPNSSRIRDHTRGKETGAAGCQVEATAHPRRTSPHGGAAVALYASTYRPLRRRRRSSATRRFSPLQVRSSSADRSCFRTARSPPLDRPSRRRPTRS